MKIIALAIIAVLCLGSCATSRSGELIALVALSAGGPAPPITTVRIYESGLVLVNDGLALNDPELLDWRGQERVQHKFMLTPSELAEFQMFDEAVAAAATVQGTHEAFCCDVREIILRGRNERAELSLRERQVPIPDAALRVLSRIDELVRKHTNSTYYTGITP